MQHSPKNWRRALAKPQNWGLLWIGLLPFFYLLQDIQNHVQNFPRLDDYRALFLAIAAKNGTLAPANFFTGFAEHITVWTNLTIVLVTYWTDFNIPIMVYMVLSLALITFTLLMLLVNHTDSNILPWVILPASIVFFSIQQNSVWLVGYTGFAWIATQLWVLITLMASYFLPKTRISFALILLLAWATQFSHGQGAVVWPLLFVSFWFWGWRKIEVYALWLVSTLLAVWIYFTLTTQSDLGLPPQLPNATINQYLQFFFAALGNMFTSREVHQAAPIGLQSFVLLMANSAILFFIDKQRRAFQIWLPIMGYSIATIGLITVARLKLFGLDYALTSWYITATTYYWIGFFVFVGLLAVSINNQSKGRYLRWPLFLLNLLFIGQAFLLFIPGQKQTLSREIEQFRTFTPHCYLRYLYVQDVVAINNEPDCKLWTTGEFNAIAYYDLALFSTYPKQNILRNDENDPVIVETDSAWANYHLHKWLLDDVSPDQIINIAPTATLPPSDFVTDAVPLPNYLAPDESLADIITDETAFWVVRLADFETSQTAFYESLLADGFLMDAYTYTTDADVVLTIERWQKLALVTDNPVVFGEQIRLAASTPIADRINACDTITLRTVWERENAPLLDGFSATFTLDKRNGDGAWDFETLARNDSQLTYTPTHEWQQDEQYLDERSLTIPCDLPAGDYVLQLGVYNYRDNERLPVDVGNTTANLAIVEQFEIK